MDGIALIVSSIICLQFLPHFVELTPLQPGEGRRYRRQCTDPHAEFTSCGKCHRKCIDNKIQEFCGSKKSDCVIGCFCIPGFVWANEIQSRCIPDNYCTEDPSLIAIPQLAESSGYEPEPLPTNQCKDPNSEFLECGFCTPTCENANVELCATVCRPGCFCKEGLVKVSEHSDQCIPKEQCFHYVGTQSPIEAELGSGQEEIVERRNEKMPESVLKPIVII